MGVVVKMDVLYGKKDRISLYRTGPIELYININYFTKQLDLVVADASGEERFLPTDLASAIARYKELCVLRKKQKGYKYA